MTRLIRSNPAKRRCLWFASLAGLTVTPWGAVHAQTGAGADTDEIIVTAQKRAEAVKDVPGSLTVLSSDALERLGVEDIADYATHVPGLTLMTEWAGQGQLTLRGVTSGKQQAGPTVGSYLDESPYNSASSASGGSNQLPDIDTFDMQRIEVLRGPQGTLYGASTMGGLIKYVTTPPDLTRQEFRMQGQLGAVDGGGTNYGVKALVNLPLVTDKVAFRASVNYRSSGGYIDDAGTGDDNVNHSTVKGGRASLLVKPNENLSIRLSALYQAIKAGGTPSTDVDFATREPLYGDRNQLRLVREPYSARYQLYNATIEQDLGGASLVSATSYARLKRSATIDTSPLFGPVIRLLGPLVTSAPLPGAVATSLDGDFRTRKITQEVRLASPEDGRLQWLVGGFYTDERSIVDQRIRAFVPGSPALPDVLATAYHLRQPSTYRETAFFANFDYRFSDAFDIAAGARWSRNRQTFGQLTSGFVNDPFAPSRVDALNSRSADEGWTFQIKPRWRINDELTAYAVASSGYRPGGPNPLPPGALTTAGVRPTYAPDKLWNYEIGVKGELLDRRLTFELAAFRIDWKNIQLLSSAGGFSFLDNGGDAVSQGGEFDFAVKPADGLTLSVNGAYTDAKLRDDAPGVGGKRRDPLPTVARWTTAATADYRFALSGEWMASAGVSYRHIGPRNSSFAASLAYPNMRIPAYDQVDLRASLENERWTLTFFVDNLFDKRGTVNFNTTNVPVGGAAQEIITAPRTLSVQLTANF